MNADPAAMIEAERFDELAELLARGVQRLVAQEGKALAPPTNSQNDLDAVAPVEAACGPQVHSPKSRKSTA